MACLTEEQLVQVALGLAEDERLPAHIEQCNACQAKLAGIRQLATQLTAAHADLDRAHTASRARLLASLANAELPSRRFGIWKRLKSRIGGLTIGQRIAAGGISVSTAAALLLILLVFANSAGRLSAMDRMLKAVREVTSYSFRLSNKTTFPPKDNAASVIRQQDDITYWRAPAASEKQWLGDLNAETKAWRVNGDDEARARDGERSLHLKEIHPTGKPGIVIIFTSKFGGKYYFRTPPVAADEIPKFSPIAKLRAVREQSGKVLCELGTKEIGGQQARGYVATFKDAAPFRDCGEVEVWVDTETDLPLEFSFKQEYDGIVDEYRVTDCRWNIELDPQLFVPTPPEGFTDTTPPNKDADISQIAAALKLYAQLSGGHFPQVADFDDKAIHDEMLKLGGFIGVPQDEWKDDPTYGEIQNAKVGLNWIARILRNKVNSGYYGSTVGPEDKDKVLLWWIAWTPEDDDLFRVFYGDLRTEILPVAKWSKLVPAEDAAGHLPEEKGKGN